VGKWLKKRVSAKVNRLHYPAPFAAIEQWVTNGLEDAAFISEAHSIAGLMQTETAKNLSRVFVLQ
jgi:3-hydroxyacyl-CoA dehydrogenase/enoyl-CoA hydratase/3-hydroxybutyryl-CoA epimerase